MRGNVNQEQRPAVNGGSGRHGNKAAVRPPAAAGTASIAPAGNTAQRHSMPAPAAVRAARPRSKSDRSTPGETSRRGESTHIAHGGCSGGGGGAAAARGAAQKRSVRASTGSAGMRMHDDGGCVGSLSGVSQLFGAADLFGANRAEVLHALEHAQPEAGALDVLLRAVHAANGAFQGDVADIERGLAAEDGGARRGAWARAAVLLVELGGGSAADLVCALMPSDEAVGGVCRQVGAVVEALRMHGTADSGTGLSVGAAAAVEDVGGGRWHAAAEAAVVAGRGVLGSGAAAAAAADCAMEDDMAPRQHESAGSGAAVAKHARHGSAAPAAAAAEATPRKRKRAARAAHAEEEGVYEELPSTGQRAEAARQAQCKVCRAECCEGDGACCAACAALVERAKGQYGKCKRKDVRWARCKLGATAGAGKLCKRAVKRARARKRRHSDAAPNGGSATKAVATVAEPPLAAGSEAGVRGAGGGEAAGRFALVPAAVQGSDPAVPHGGVQGQEDAGSGGSRGEAVAPPLLTEGADSDTCICHICSRGGVRAACGPGAAEKRCRAKCGRCSAVLSRLKAKGAKNRRLRLQAALAELPDGTHADLLAAAEAHAVERSAEAAGHASGVNGDHVAEGLGGGTAEAEAAGAGAAEAGAAEAGAARAGAAEGFSARGHAEGCSSRAPLLRKCNACGQPKTGSRPSYCKVCASLIAKMYRNGFGAGATRYVCWVRQQLGAEAKPAAVAAAVWERRDQFLASEAAAAAARAAGRVGCEAGPSVCTVCSRASETGSGPYCSRCNSWRAKLGGKGVIAAMKDAFKELGAKAGFDAVAERVAELRSTSA
eukprot:jgi/Ulvmu1/9556/UM053_0045.1